MIKNIVLIGTLFLITGCTTLHTAASKGNVKAIDRLVKEEANLDETDSEGNTPLMYAVMLNQKDSLNALLKAGADVNTQSESGNTALHEAVLQGNLKFASLLLEHGADVKVRNKEGKTALDIAISKEKDVFIQLLDKSPKTVTTTKPVESSKPKVSQVKSIETVKNTQIPLVVKEENIVTTKSTKADISKEEATSRLRKMIMGRETIGIRNFLNEYPEAVDYIEEPMQRIRYIGPSGWRVIDIIEYMGKGKYKENDVIAHINSAKLPYKKFSAEELKLLNRYAISPSIIEAMINVSK